VPWGTPASEMYALLPCTVVIPALNFAVSTGSIFGSISIGSVVGDPQQLLSYLFQGFATTFLPGSASRHKWSMGR